MFTKVYYQECEGNPANLVVNAVFPATAIHTIDKQLLAQEGQWVPFPTEEGHDYMARVILE